MLGEFTYRGKTYCIKDELQFDYTPEEVVNFSSLAEVRAFFGAAMDDPGAWPVIMTIAKWKYPGICRPPANCPEPTDEEFFNALCLQVFNGRLTLIDKTRAPNRFPTINDVTLKPCCIETIKRINSVFLEGDIIVSVIVILPFFNAFLSHPGMDKWTSLASTALSIGSEDWDSFSETVKMIPLMYRRLAHNIAYSHAVEHEIKNDNELKLLWQGVVNAFQ